MKYLPSKLSLAKILAAGCLLSACRNEHNVNNVTVEELKALGPVYRKHFGFDLVKQAINEAPEIWGKLSIEHVKNLIDSGILRYCSSEGLNLNIKEGVFPIEDAGKFKLKLEQLVGLVRENIKVLSDIYCQLFESSCSGLFLNKESLINQFFKPEEMEELNMITGDSESGKDVFGCSLCLVEFKRPAETDSIYIAECNCRKIVHFDDSEKQMKSLRCIKLNSVYNLYLLFQSANLDDVAGLNTLIIKEICNSKINKKRFKQTLKCITKIVGPDVEYIGFYLRILSDASEENFKILTDSSFNLSEELVRLLKKLNKNDCKDVLNRVDLSTLSKMDSYKFELFCKNPSAFVDIVTLSGENIFEMNIEKLLKLCEASPEDPKKILKLIQGLCSIPPVTRSQLL